MRLRNSTEPVINHLFVGKGNSRANLSSEKRWLTVLFADLVDSTALSEKLEPEDYRELVSQMREVCIESLEAYQGNVAKLLGDGIMASFGYPQAAERGAQAAVNAGMDMVRRMKNTTWSVKLPRGRSLKLRVGIHTGIVVVGDLGSGGSWEQGALVGMVPNVASRIHSCAEPDSVVISDATYDQLREEFETENLGPHTFTGLSEPVIVHKILSARPDSAQAERVKMQPLRPLVARQRELEELRGYWKAVARGKGRTLLVVGEPGIGKSRLLIELLNEIKAKKQGRILEFQGAPYQTDSSFHPVRELLAETVCGFRRDMAAEKKHERIDRVLTDTGLHSAESKELLADFLSVPPAQAAALQPEVRKERTLRLLQELFMKLAGDKPALWFFNDLHWMDASTLGWVRALALNPPPRTLIVFCTRPEEEVLLELPGVSDRLEPLPLDHAGVRAMAETLCSGKTLPSEIVEQIATQSGGVPLFIEELTNMLLGSCALRDRGHYYEVADSSALLHTPSTLQGLLAARLDKLGSAKSIAQVCSVIGDEFSVNEALALLPPLGLDEIKPRLDELVNENILVKINGGEGVEPRYRFRHMLVQSVAYESLLSAARSRYHQRIAELMMNDTAVSGQHEPSLVAQHLTLAGQFGPAVPYWLQATGAALSRSANVEAAAHAQRGLDAVRDAGSPESLRELELMLTTMRGTALIASKGFAAPEVGEAFAHAAKLIEKRTNSQSRFPAMWGLWVYHLMSGKLEAAAGFAREILALGRASKDDGIIVEGLWAAGVVDVWHGKLKDGAEALQAAIDAYRPEHAAHAMVTGQDPGVAARVYLAVAQLYRGYTEESEELSNEAIAIARKMGHAHTLAWALGGGTMIRLGLGDVDGALTLGAETVQHCTEHPHPFWLGSTLAWMGWAQLQKGDLTAARSFLNQSQTVLTALGTALAQPMFCAVFADVSAACGDVDEAAGWVLQGRTLADRYQENITLPALWLVTGQVWLRQNPNQGPEAENAFREALRIATAQGSRVRQVQAAAAVAQMLFARGEDKAAIAILKPHFTWFEKRKNAYFMEPIRQFYAALTAGGNS
jgi:class 3 adenylate cyclase/tetratricopeptide (TPR) repeat protein